MTAQLSPDPVQKFFANDGTPLAFGKLFSYIAGTTTKQATYTDYTQTTPNTNPVILNSRGEANVWLDPTKSYKLTLSPSTDTDPPTSAIWTVDQINGSLSPSASIIPSVDNVYNLGSTTNRWANAYISQQIYIGLNNYPTYDATNKIFGYIGQTAAESVASVTPTNYGYAPGDVRRYNAKGDGSTDDSAAFALAALVSGTHPMIVPFAIPFTTPTYKITTPFVLPANGSIVGQGSPQLTASVNGSHIFSATGVGGVITISGIKLLGTSSSAAPSTGFGGFSANNTGLVTISNCNKVRITDCEASTFFNGITVQGCNRVWIQRNVVDTFNSIGVLVSQSTRFDITHNDISNCTQAGGVVAYGINCTGNASGGQASQYSSISFNRIKDIPSWDAIGTHDIDGLRVIGNDCRNVRHGIDIGHLVSTNVVKNITIASNYVEGYTSDTWGGTASEIGAIIVEGYDATHRVLGCNISNNQINGFFNVVGAVGGGYGAGCIAVANTDDCNVTGNVITNCGTAATSQATGIFLTGTCNRLTVTSNSLQGGNFNRGGIRANALVSDATTIVGNSGVYTTTSCNHVAVISSTIGALNVSSNPTNSTVPYIESAATTTVTSNATLAGSGNAATAVTTGSTLPTAFGFLQCTVAGASTGNILTPGIFAGQETVVINSSGANSITMAAAGTSNVADGATCVISPNTYKRFVWNAASSLWYHS